MHLIASNLHCFLILIAPDGLQVLAENGASNHEDEDAPAESDEAR